MTGTTRQDDEYQLLALGDYSAAFLLTPFGPSDTLRRPLGGVLCGGTPSGVVFDPHKS